MKKKLDVSTIMGTQGHVMEAEGHWKNKHKGSESTLFHSCWGGRSQGWELGSAVFVSKAGWA